MLSKERLGPWLSLAAAAIAFPSAQAATITLTPEADVTLHSRTATTNYAGSPTLKIDGQPVSKVLMKFRLSGLARGQTVSGATLKIYSTSSSPSGGKFYGVSDSSWLETAATYANAPSFGSKIASLGGVAPNKTYSIDVTPLLKGKGNGVYSIGIAHDSAEAAQYHSKDATSNQPRLVLTVTDPVAPPSSGAATTPTPTPAPTPTRTRTPTPAPAPSSSHPSSPAGSTQPGTPATNAPAAAMTFTPIYGADQTIGGKIYGVDSKQLAHSIGRSKNGKVYRFEVNTGEGRLNGRDEGSKPSDRAELSGSDYKYPIGTEIWTSYSFLFEEGERLPGEDWNILGQWHAGTGSPVLNMQLPFDNVLQIELRNDEGKLLPFKKTDFQRGRWYHVVMKTRFGPKADIQVWFDGQLVVNQSGRQVGYGSSEQNYWKFGIYRQRFTGGPHNQKARFANMEVGSVGELGGTLLHRVGNPLPIAE